MFLNKMCKVLKQKNFIIENIKKSKHYRILLRNLKKKKNNENLKVSEIILYIKKTNVNT